MGLGGSSYTTPRPRCLLLPSPIQGKGLHLGLPQSAVRQVEQAQPCPLLSPLRRGGQEGVQCRDGEGNGTEETIQAEGKTPQGGASGEERAAKEGKGREALGRNAGGRVQAGARMALLLIEAVSGRHPQTVANPQTVAVSRSAKY